MERVSEVGEVLGETLKSRLSDLAWVGDIRGVGFLWGIELVRDKASNTPFPRKHQVTEKIWQTLFETASLPTSQPALPESTEMPSSSHPHSLQDTADFERVADKIRAAIEQVLPL